MATYVPHSGPAGISTPGTPRSARSTAARTTPRAVAPTTIPAKTVTSRKVSGYEPGDEPSKASSVFPVLAAFGALFAVAFGAAYFGRDLIAVIGQLLGT
ncbi:hypothetical protein [Sanguibacter suarezii]|uniref:hypothetical protein n=1 Tax=Sanguibacter suarezii TaxID=60921 RepID=UPI000833DCCB|nr:hypothetical protein [Sanguibacter suarezii]